VASDETESGPARSIAPVLAEIAGIASETLELRDVLGRIAISLRSLIPFEHMGVIRLIDDEHAIVHASTLVGGIHSPTDASPPAILPLTAWSPRMRPRPIPRRFDDARGDFDPTFHVDARALEGGVRSAIWEPFHSANSFRGGVWLASTTPAAFTDEHQATLRPIAALLGSAVEHWTIVNAERRRRERLERVETLLGSLAESLDVREVFERLSGELQSILPHHLMNLTEIDLRARTIRIAAFAGSCDLPIRTDPFPLHAREVEDRIDFAIIHDIPAELAPTTQRHRLIRESGLRSWLHVPVWISGEVKGSLSFLHREPSRYDRDDAEVALRVAARVALTLSHGKLAEEARIASAARDKAARLEATVQSLTKELESRAGHGRVVGVSQSWKEALRHVGRVANSETTVLITGESGTGKEVISTLVHKGSARAEQPFVAINCAALPEQLLESELFGHEKGAFTGAIATKIGRIEQAERGTLFLDEIAEMSPLVQAKFLRVLEQREFQRVGGTRTIKADIRVIAATNRDLAAAIERQHFREDLYYRLNVFQIHIAPLRERRDDILPLAETFLEDLGRTMGRPAAGISRSAREWLRAYSWPGNVRELRNAIERAILLCDGEAITNEHLSTPSSPAAKPPAALSAAASAGASRTDNVDLGTMERDLIQKALLQSRGNKSQAARMLGLTRAQLYARLDKHGIR
jgi:transcriptional regulator with GAF, ATPase, and Fis domain